MTRSPIDVCGAAQEHRIAQPLGRRQQQHRLCVRRRAPAPAPRTGRRGARRSATGPGSGAAPRSCSTVNAAGSSTSASGLPSVAATMSAGDGLVDRSRRRPRSAAGGPRWRTVRRGRSRRMPSNRPRASACSRIVTSDATRSARSRRPTNDSATADSSSSHCASSMTASTGWARAASATRLRTARPTRNGSSASCSDRAEHGVERRRVGVRRAASTQSRSGSTSWCTPAYPKAISDSTPAMRTTRKSGRDVDRVLDQRRLADAGRADEQERTAGAALGVVEDGVDPGAFGGATDERDVPGVPPPARWSLTVGGADAASGSAAPADPTRTAAAVRLPRSHRRSRRRRLSPSRRETTASTIPSDRAAVDR